MRVAQGPAAAPLPPKPSPSWAAVQAGPAAVQQPALLRRPSPAVRWWRHVATCSVSRASLRGWSSARRPAPSAVATWMAVKHPRPRPRSARPARSSRQHGGLCVRYSAFCFICIRESCKAMLCLIMCLSTFHSKQRVPWLAFGLPPGHAMELCFLQKHHKDLYHMFPSGILRMPCWHEAHTLNQTMFCCGDHLWMITASQQHTCTCRNQSAAQSFSATRTAQAHTAPAHEPCFFRQSRSHVTKLSPPHKF